MQSTSNGLESGPERKRSRRLAMELSFSLWQINVPRCTTADVALSSSKKLIKGGLGFFLSPREETKDNGSSKIFVNLPSAKKSNNWDNEGLNLDPGSSEVEVQDKDYIDDIPVIPSLDDFANDDLTNEIAKAPVVSVKQVTSYKDLETDLLRHSAFASLDEVNLQLLIKLLHPESYLDEPDVPWTREGLFNEIVSIFNERKS